jgi:hypothetical protein
MEETADNSRRVTKRPVPKVPVMSCDLLLRVWRFRTTTRRWIYRDGPRGCRVGAGYFEHA